MNVRLSFTMVFCIAALGMGCDDNGGGTDAGPTITLDGSTGDAGTGTDAGPMVDVDSGPAPGCGMPQPPGQEGGHCRGGTTCLTGLTCAEELTMNMGMNFTLGNTFVINFREGTVEPDRPGECATLGAVSDVPIGGFPMGGLCTQACDPASTGTCGECASCTEDPGLSPGIAQLISVGTFDIAPITSEAQPGVCQQNCQWNGTDNGGCPSGYSCDPGSNICIAACTTDSQCQVNFLNSEEDQICVALNGTATCNTATGQCEEPGASGAFGDACDSNAECQAQVGICLIGGRCSNYQCSSADGMSAGAAPCPADAICAGIGGNGGSLCFGLCDTPADCFEGQACSPEADLPDGRAGLCSPICGDDSECQGTQRCLKGRFQNPDLGFCSDYCVPEGGTADPMATACEADQFCRPVEGEDYGFCLNEDGVCGSPTACVGDQACLVTGTNLAGRCVDGCETNADCTGAEECVITDDDDPETPPVTRGVCRAPGGECSASPLVGTAMTELNPMLGDDQCIPSQECSQTMATDPRTTGTCVDR